MAAASVFAGICVAVLLSPSSGPAGVGCSPAGQRGSGAQVPALPPLPGYIPVYIQSGDSPPDVQRLYDEAQREESQRTAPSRRAQQVGDASAPAPATQQPRVPRPQDVQRSRPASPAAPAPQDEPRTAPRSRLASGDHVKDAGSSRVTKKGGAVVPAADTSAAVPATASAPRRPPSQKKRTGPSQYRAPVSQKQRQEQQQHQKAAQTRKRQHQQRSSSSSSSSKQQPEQPQTQR